MLFEHGHGCRVRFANATYSPQVFANEVQGVVIIVSIEEDGEIPVSEETP